MSEKPTYEELENKIQELEQSVHRLRQAEEAFKKRKRQLIESQKVAKLGSWDLDFISQQLDWSDETYRLFDTDSEEYKPSFDEFARVVHPDDYETMQTSFNKALECDETPYHVVVRIINDSGREWTMEAFGKVRRDQNGNALSIFGTAQDVTQINLTTALKESEEQFSLFMDYLPAIVFIKDIKSKTLYVNKTMNEVLGAKDWIGKTSLDLFPKDIAEAMIEDDKKTLDQVYRVIVETVPDKHGENRIFQTHKFKINRSGKPPLLGGIALDITEQRQTEDALLAREKEYRETLNNLLIGVVVHSSDTSILYSNPEASTILGLTQDQMSGKKTMDPAWQFVNEDSTNMKIDDYPVSRVFSTNKSLQDYVAVIIRPDRDYITWVIVNAIPILSNANEFEKVIVNFVDITDLKNAQEDKIKAQRIVGEQKKFALIGQIAGKMAHDFNNILGVIMGNAQISLIESKEPKTKKTLELIFEQTIRGKNLTKNLVAFARDQEPKQEFFRINEKMDLVLNLLKKDLEGIELIKEDKPGIPDLLADPGMIEHALVNLVQNSIHAVGRVVNPRITMRSYCLDDNIYFEIEDNGCGIPKEYYEKIYEPSFTLKGSKDVTGSYKSDVKGTGYGMANVKKYIEQHKGKILIESEFGSGTKFTISLPVIKKELTSKEKIEINESKTHFGKYILLVEDEQAISDVQYNILTRDPCNHKIDIAPKGQIAMDLSDRNKYDLISLDYILPGGINGMDVYNHIRETDKAIPILFISGNIEFLESIKELKQNDPYIDHLSKPCQNQDYIEGINGLLEKITILKQKEY